jgi:hypothetical protein
VLPTIENYIWNLMGERIPNFPKRGLQWVEGIWQIDIKDFKSWEKIKYTNLTSKKLSLLVMQDSLFLIVEKWLYNHIKNSK